MSNNAMQAEPFVMKQIAPRFSVSGEMTENDLISLHKEGVDTLINVRPDNEYEGQINSEQWAELAKKYKLHYIFIPVKPCQYTQHDIEALKAALMQSSSAAHGFCRTGTRAAHLWALANREHLVFCDLENAVNQAGYTLDLIKDMFHNH